MLAADVGYAFFRLVAGAEFALVPYADRIAQRHHAGRRRVLRLVLVNRLDGGLLDMVWRREVRLSRAEVGNIHTFGLELIRSGDDGGGRRDLYAVDAVRKLHCFSL